jgi:hypothetical protein
MEHQIHSTPLSQAWHNERGSLLVQKAGLAMATAVLILGLAVMFSTRGGEIGQSLVQVFTCQLGRFGGGGAGCGAPAAATPGGGATGGPAAPQANAGGGNGWLDGLQTALDVVGLIPVIGEPVDLVNGVIYAVRGDWVNAGLSWTAMIPIGGQFATGSKLVLKYGDEAVAVVRQGDNVGDAARTGQRVPCVGTGMPRGPALASVALPAITGVLASGGDNCFINQLPDRLQGELEVARRLGVNPIRGVGPEFDRIVNEGPVKWAVTAEGELVVIPKYVNQTEIPHSVLTNGGPVRAAGEANIAGEGGNYFGIDIDNHSGHFRPSPESLQIGREAFERWGIVFP